MLSLEKCKRVESLKLQMGNFAQKTNKQNKAKNLEQKFNWKTRENELFGLFRKCACVTAMYLVPICISILTTIWNTTKL